MTTKKNVFVFLFDEYADWEVAYSMAGINKSNRYRIRTIALDKTMKKSLAGLSVIPDLDFLPEIDLSDIDITNTAMLILPGGEAWTRGENEEINALVEHCVQHGIPVAAICAATVFLADHGRLDAIKHTNNDLKHLNILSPNYAGQLLYEHKPGVCDGGIITASGNSAIEFASNIFKTLNINYQKDTCNCFQYFDKVIV